MGRRSTKTTKAGKFMNPTDQWRKEQRRKELKKNKKQRTAVREAVLRLKDPIVLLKEIEEIEKAEGEIIANVADPNELLPSEKGLLEKKKKLHGNLDRIVKYWQKTDPKKAHDVKQLILDSEKKRREDTKLYDSYKEARSQTEVSDIPLPTSLDGASILPSDIPMPDDLIPLPSHQASEQPPPPPGPPPGAPPADLREFNFVESSLGPAKRTVRFAAGDGEDDEEDEGDEEEDQDMEEGDEEDEESSSVDDSEGEEFDPDASTSESLSRKSTIPAPRLPPPPPGPPPLFTPRFPPPMGVRLPPGPPPMVPPNLRPPSAMFAPPPPPPRLPPPPSAPHIQSQAVISSQPRSTQSSGSGAAGGAGAGGGGGGGGQRAIISAQPQLRNIQAEVTKFMPTSLRVRREVPRPSAGRVKSAKQAQTAVGSRGGAARDGGRRAGLQGDAYDAFMKEMEGIL